MTTGVDRRAAFLARAPSSAAGEGWRDDRRDARFVIELPRVLGADQCDLLLSYITDLGQLEGVIASKDGQERILDLETRRVRQTVVTDTPEMSWVYDVIAQTIGACNRDVFGFDLRGFNEELVIVDYREGDFYNWHLDVGAGAITRKLSVSVVLSAPEQYDGGGLTFPEAKVGRVPRGGAVVFPSFLLHGVQPVTRGRRVALVGWIGGPRFR